MPVGDSGDTFRPMVPLSRTAPLTPLTRQRTVLPPPRRTASTGRSGRSGRSQRDAGLQSGQVHDLEEDIGFDPVSPFRRPGDTTRDSMTLSARIKNFIDQRRNAGKLRIWAENVAEKFSWAAQNVKSFVHAQFGKDRPGLVSVTSNGFYIAG